LVLDSFLASKTKEEEKEEKEEEERSIDIKSA
jgi:hypothetical protein